MSTSNHALVIGGGIAGLTAGIALRRKGIRVDLIEMAPSLAVYGVGIIQPNNTLRALDRIGLARACVEAGAPFSGWQIFDSVGHLLMEAPGPTTAAPEFPAVNGITRPALHQILSGAAVDAGVRLHLDTTLTEMSQDASAVHVVFSDARSASYDLVIACDGIQSDTRHRLFGDLVAPAFTGQGVWRYNLPRPASMEWGGIYFGASSKVGLVPLSADTMYMFLVTAEPGNPRHETSGLAVAMRNRLAEYGGLVADLAALITAPEAVVSRPLFHLMLPKPWHQGRVVVIGDAAHASTPHLAQGAAMAIEDAVLLAELVGDPSAPVEDLLDGFVARRFDRARFVIETSSTLAGWELEAWEGTHNPQADPGGLLHRSTIALMEDY